LLSKNDKKHYLGDAKMRTKGQKPDYVELDNKPIIGLYSNKSPSGEVRYYYYLKDNKRISATSSLPTALQRFFTQSAQPKLDASIRTKNHKNASQPIPTATADLFKQWKAAQNVSGADRVFINFTTNDRPADMIKADLAAAGLPITDYADRPIVFHSLRNSYISFLAETNAPLKLIQELARHSKPEMTFNTYARVRLKSSSPQGFIRIFANGLIMVH
jgi:hypothetical protein